MHFNMKNYLKSTRNYTVRHVQKRVYVYNSIYDL
jgi:hypothetical protein